MVRGASQRRAAAASESASLDPPQGGSYVDVDCPVQRILTFEAESTDVVRVQESTPGGATRKNWRKLIKSDTADILEKYSILAGTKDLKRKIPDSEVHDLLSYVLDDHRKSIKRMREETSVLQEEKSIVVSRYEHCKERFGDMTRYTESLRKLVEQTTDFARAFQGISMTSRLIFDATEEMLAGLNGLEEEGLAAHAASVSKVVPVVPTPAIGPVRVEQELSCEVHGTIIDKCCVTADGYIAQETPVYSGSRAVEVHLVLVKSRQDAVDAKGHSISDGYFFFQKDLTRLLHAISSGKREVKDLGQWARGPGAIPGHSIFSIKPGDIALASSAEIQDIDIDILTRAPKGLVFIRTDYTGTVLQKMCGTILNDKKVSKPNRDAIVERVHRIKQILFNFSRSHTGNE